MLLYWHAYDKSNGMIVPHGVDKEAAKQQVVEYVRRFGGQNATLYVQAYTNDKPSLLVAIEYYSTSSGWKEC